MDREILEGICTFEELKDFCEEHTLDSMDNVYENTYEFDTLVRQHIRENEWSWESIFSALRDLDSSGSDWYEVTGALSYSPLDDTFDSEDFREYKSRVLRECIECGLFVEHEEDFSELENILIKPSSGSVEATDEKICANEEDIDKFFGINVSEV